jgi:hypothetical protein
MPPPIGSHYPGIWHVQHSSRERWHGKRNVHAEFTAEGSIDYTYQERESSEVKAYKDTDWKVVVDGKDGYLQCWMKETEYGIEDSAGEASHSCSILKRSKRFDIRNKASLNGLMEANFAIEFKVKSEQIRELDGWSWPSPQDQIPSMVSMFSAIVKQRSRKTRKWRFWVFLS